MKDRSIHIIILFIIAFILLLLSECSSLLDTMSANQQIKDGATLVSEREMFELGFFSPGKSKKRYLGIWYNKISYGTVVWVANRETPIADKSGILKLSTVGNLVILSGSNPMVWSSNSNGSNDPVVQLLDTGNLVVWSKKNSTQHDLIWQSFDYMGDTMLPGMKMGKDLVTGLERTLTSWKSPDDPSRGEYSDIVDPNGYPQTYRWRGKVLLSRMGPWNGVGFSGFPTEKENLIYNTDFVITDKEVYHFYELKSSVVQRVVLSWDGKAKILQWVERIKDWIVYTDILVDTCDRYSLCGPYGVCSINKHPPCTCMQGFQPQDPEAWESSDWVSGCVRKTSLNCNDANWFSKVAGVKVPDTRKSWHNKSMTLGECEMTCKKNCSCTAYATLDIRNGGSGCLLWHDELIDTREYDENQDIYIKMSADFKLEGHLDSQSGFNETKRILILVIITSSFVPLFFVLAYAYRKRMQTTHVKGAKIRYVLKEKNRSVQMESLDDIQFFSLMEVVRATSNFSASNKIGEGGFGPVYKGVLKDGREIAVKRLSKASQQGLDEFKNEVICVAKLQHRNLVKLLGYCIHKNELILIYEYMPNKSLDYFLFDEIRSVTLDWPQRFNIIQGIARGMLYLHQDSRLQIIHRDLKAGNILLDSDMNPKISDFGLARKFVGHDASIKTKKVVGTYGYISPEYAVHGRISIKSDVFSFGVLVLEIISGKKNKEFSHGDHRNNLLGHAWKLYKDGRSIELTSETLKDSYVNSEVLKAIHVALLCVQHHAEDRPTMLSVVLMLVSESVLPRPKQPAFFNEESQSEVQLKSVSGEYMITQMYAR